jgi:hypothetical protein
MAEITAAIVGSGNVGQEDMIIDIAIGLAEAAAR